MKQLSTSFPKSNSLATAVSFEEFKSIFQKKTDALATQACLLPAESTMEDGTTLVGIDAKIPGGKYDVSKGSTS